MMNKEILEERRSRGRGFDDISEEILSMESVNDVLEYDIVGNYNLRQKVSYINKRLKEETDIDENMYSVQKSGDKYLVLRNF